MWMCVFVIIMATSGQFHQGMWIRAGSLAFPDSISEIIDMADELEITDIYAQVVVSGYAYYKSDILPRSQYLSKVSGPDYDPLDTIIRICKRKSIKVHAWVNTYLVWSLKEMPDSANHLLYKYPEWFIQDVRQRSMANYTFEEWKGLGLEGLYLDPTQPKIRSHLARVCVEIAHKYPIDGIHLDFIRYPGTLWGLPQTEKGAVFIGSEADTLRWLDLVRYARINIYLRWMVWNYWHFNKEREFLIFQIVQETSRTVKQNAKKKDCLFTAALFANPGLACFSFSQTWWNWGDVIDYPVIMSYTPDIGLFADFLDFGITQRKDAIFGIGFLWSDMEDEAIWEIEAVKKKSGAGVCYFDYTNLDTLVNLEKIKGGIINEDSLTIDSTRFAAVSNVFIDVPDSHVVKNGEGLIAWGEDLEFGAFLLSISLNPQRDLARMNLDVGGFLKIISNEVAVFKFLDNCIFPLGDKLIEPPNREVDYEFFPWEDDSVMVKTSAETTKKLTQHATLYPWAMDKFARAVFGAKKGKREVLSTYKGIYTFKVKKIHKGGKKIKRQVVKPELLPLYLNWTIKTKFNEIVHRR